MTMMMNPAMVVRGGRRRGRGGVVPSARPTRAPCWPRRRPMPHLSENGVNVNAGNKHSGYTALHLASGHRSIIIITTTIITSPDNPPCLECRSSVTRNGRARAVAACHEPLAAVAGLEGRNRPHLPVAPAQAVQQLQRPGIIPDLRDHTRQHTPHFEAEIQARQVLYAEAG
jgi:hypothetical protein